jgi:hypothetical protein
MQGEHGVLERGVRAPQAERQPGRLSDTPIDDINRKTYLSAAEGADLACRPSVNAFRKWARSRQVPKVLDGGRVLYRRKDVQAALEAKAQQIPMVEKESSHKGRV